MAFHFILLALYTEEDMLEEDEYINDDVYKNYVPFWKLQDNNKKGIFWFVHYAKTCVKLY